MVLSTFTVASHLIAVQETGASDMQLSLKLAKLAVLLSNDKHDKMLPVAEAAVQNMLVELQYDSGQASVKALSTCDLLADVYNSSKMCWEPVVEPWRLSVGAYVHLSR